VRYIDDAERAGLRGNQSVMRPWGVNDNKHLRFYTTPVLYVPHVRLAVAYVYAPLPP